MDADHFAVVLPEVKQDGDVARLIEKTMDAFLEHPYRLNDAVFRIAAKLSLAHSLNLKVVAEGLETEEQSRLLKCDEMQGYLFSKPVPVDIFEANFLVLS